MFTAQANSFYFKFKVKLIKKEFYIKNNCIGTRFIVKYFKIFEAVHDYYYKSA